MMMRGIRFKTTILSLAVFLGLIFFWQLADYYFNIKEIILPTPLEISQAIVNNFDILWRETLVTTIEALLGLTLGFILAIIIAVWFTFSKTSKGAFYPYAIALKATPLYALAPVLVLWFGNDIYSKVVMAALVAFFPILVNSVQGFNAVSQDELDLMRSMSASKLQIFLKLRLFKALPFIFPALKIASTLAVVGAIIAEFTGSSRGIGHLIVNSSYYLETSLMFAGIFSISLVGVVLFGIISLIEKKVLYWKYN